MRTALTIAGSDSSGGAGIQADLKTFSALGVYGMSAITAVTAQNTCGVSAVQDISPEITSAQIEAVFSDIRVDAVKIGMVSRVETIEAIASALRRFAPRCVVLDPVMVAKSGHRLIQPDAVAALCSQLFPLADVITPNIPEAEVLLGETISDVPAMERAARALRALGARFVLVKGGHLVGEAVDVLFDGERYMHFTALRIPTRHTHGTGCTLSAAIAAHLALGCSVPEAVARAKEYISGAIAEAFALGQGVGPVHHFFDLYRKAGVNIGSQG
ncbi:MAG: bifunctional hydroxymethylpyrimidine kinase/phosphomethylpyrimidine kinase [Selenomonadales bacterium]|nr:bifunctional hydroxymethylpyrimidine kinase/phosphomethylpyrimidine kinase [Selenomonadales bacterium]